MYRLKEELEAELTKWRVLALTGAIFALLLGAWAIGLKTGGGRAPRPAETTFRLVLDIGEGLRKKPDALPPLIGLDENEVPQ